ncbi:MAG: choice-of-anchor A family protein, partial [Nocardioides sp.]
MLGLLLAASGATVAVSVGGSAGASTPTPASCVTTYQPLGAATGWTEFIEGSGSRGSESEGSIAWGGNLNASGMTVGTRLQSAAHQTTLVVAGTHGSFNLQKGSAYVVPATGVNFNGGGHYLAANPIDFAAAFADLRTRSAGLATATATGTAALGVVGGQSYLVLTGTDPDLNVFSLTPAQLASGAGIAYDVPQGAGVLVNVSGAAVTLHGQMWIKHNGSFSQVNDNVMAHWPEILWNFPQATTVTMSFGSAWGGSILAPDAALNVSSVGHTIGQVIAKTFSSNYETHQLLYPSSPCLPPVPNAENPSISLDKTASAITDLDGNGPDAGDTITYTFEVTNTGDVALDPVTVTDPMFPGLTCPAGALAAGASVSCAPQTHTLTGADVTTGSVDNTAVAEGTSPGGTTVDDDDSTSTPVVPLVGPANVKVTKVVDDTTPTVGQVVTYTLQVTNPGASAADAVVLTDVLPSGVTFVSADAPCTLSGTTVTCAFGTLAAGAGRTVTIKATVVAPPAVPAHEHQVDIQKTEAHVDLEPGQSRT